MSQFGLSSSNSHWGYGGAGAYPAYLPSCAAPAATQFNPPALGFAGTVPDQTPTQDFTNNTGKRFIAASVIFTYVCLTISASTKMLLYRRITICIEHIIV